MCYLCARTCGTAIKRHNALICLACVKMYNIILPDIEIPKEVTQTPNIPGF